MKRSGASCAEGASFVAPFAGAGIETFSAFIRALTACVAPFAGAGIETRTEQEDFGRVTLPPSRGQELKLAVQARTVDDGVGCPLRGGRN